MVFAWQLWPNGRQMWAIFSIVHLPHSAASFPCIDSISLIFSRCLTEFQVCLSAAIVAVATQLLSPFPALLAFLFLLHLLPLALCHYDNAREHLQQKKYPLTKWPTETVAATEATPTSSGRRIPIPAAETADDVVETCQCSSASNIQSSTPYRNSIMQGESWTAWEPRRTVLRLSSAFATATVLSVR